MASLKKFKTTAHFKRTYRREVYKTMQEIRANERQHTPKIVKQLLRNTLRQRSGHYMKKGIRQCYDQIPAEHKELRHAA
jgi:hypothetical protein